MKSQASEPVCITSEADLPWTGERFIPTLTGQIATEHLHRYAIACTLADGKDVLDIASGEGYGSALLAQASRTVTGVDLSLQAVEHAQRKYKKSNLRFLQGDCTSIPVADASMDMVVSYETIEHITQQELFLKEIRRILRPGGVFIVSTPEISGYNSVRADLNPYHLRELSRTQFESLLKSHFVQVACYGQRYSSVSTVLPEQEAPSATVTYFQGNSHEIGSSLALPNPVYIVAVCSDSPIPKINPGFFELQAQPDHPDPQALFLQVFGDDGTGYNESLSTSHQLSNSRWQTIQIGGIDRLLQKLDTHLRIDPVNKPGLIHLASIRLIAENGEILFEAQKKEDFEKIFLKPGICRIETATGVTLLAPDDDPQFSLPILPAGSSKPSILEIHLQVECDPGRAFLFLHAQHIQPALLRTQELQQGTAQLLNQIIHLKDETRQREKTAVEQQTRTQELSNRVEAQESNLQQLQSSNQQLTEVLTNSKAEARQWEKTAVEQQTRAQELSKMTEDQKNTIAQLQEELAIWRSTSAEYRKAVNSALEWQSRSWFKRAFHRWRLPSRNFRKAGFFKKLERSIRKRRKKLIKTSDGMRLAGFFKGANNLKAAIRKEISPKLLPPASQWYIPKLRAQKILASCFLWVGAPDRYTTALHLKRFRFQSHGKPKISVVIPIYNQLSYTLYCLESIANHAIQCGIEVIIADDNSKKNVTKTIAQLFPDARIITNTGVRGFLGNCNNAAGYAVGDYILFLNNDTLLQKDSVNALLEVFERFPDVGAVGSMLLYPDGKLQEAGGIVWQDASAWNYGWGDDPEKSEYNYVRETDYCSAASLLVERDLFEKIGRFSTEYIPAYYEDTDLAFKIRAAGRKVYYQPKSRVTHFEGKSCGKDLNSGIKSYQVVNQTKFRDKWRRELLEEHVENGVNPFRARERGFQKKVVLFIDHYVPTIDQDAGSRSTFHYIQLFLSKGYVVKFIGDNFAKMQPYTDMLQQMGVEVLYGDWYCLNIRPWLLQNAKNIDIVFTNRSHITIKYLDILQQLPRARVLYYGHDIGSLRLERLYQLTKDIGTLENSRQEYANERTLWNAVHATYYPSPEEAKYVKEKCPECNVRAIPLNILEPRKTDYSGTIQQRSDLLFVGGFAHHPNEDGVLWFLDNCWPAIAEALPDCKFYVAGSKPTSSISARKSKRVIVTGWLSDPALEALYSRIRLVVNPLRYGGGIKGKVVEAMRYGVPQVATPMAVEGLPGIEACALVQETAQDFAASVIRAYRDEPTLMEYSSHCSEYIRQHFSAEAAWETISQDIITLNK